MITVRLNPALKRRLAAHTQDGVTITHEPIEVSNDLAKQLAKQNYKGRSLVEFVGEEEEPEEEVEETKPKAANKKKEEAEDA